MFDNLITPCILSPPRFCRNHHCHCAFCVKVLKWNKPRYHSSSRINSKFFTPCILSSLTSSVHTQCVPSVIVALSHLVHTEQWALGAHYKGRSALGGCCSGYYPTLQLLSHWLHTQCDSSCLTLGIHWTLGIHIGYTGYTLGIHS